MVYSVSYGVREKNKCFLWCLTLKVPNMSIPRGQGGLLGVLSLSQKHWGSSRKFHSHPKKYKTSGFLLRALAPLKKNYLVIPSVILLLIKVDCKFLCKKIITECEISFICLFLNCRLNSKHFTKFIRLTKTAVKRRISDNTMSSVST